jgi:hypothetical protein
MKTINLIIISFFVILVFGCSKSNDLESSIMIYDSEYTDLPAYTEWGYNTFGAYYDRKVFVSNNLAVPCKIVSTDTGLTIRFDGQMSSSTYGYANTSVTFLLKGFKPLIYEDLIIFNDTIVDLLTHGNQVIFKEGSTTKVLDLIKGNINFKRAQNLVVDSKKVSVILSGLFDFKFMLDGFPVTMSNGRFDLGMNDNNFYYIAK